MIYKTNRSTNIKLEMKVVNNFEGEFLMIHKNGSGVKFNLFSQSSNSYCKIHWALKSSMVKL